MEREEENEMVVLERKGVEEREAIVVLDSKCEDLNKKGGRGR